MKVKRRVEIQIETERLTIRHTAAEARRFLFCTLCDADVEVVTVEQAALLSGQTLRSIIHQIETDALHFIETIDGLLHICQNSLLLVIGQCRAIAMTLDVHDAEVMSGDAIKLLKE